MAGARAGCGGEARQTWAQVRTPSRYLPLRVRTFGDFFGPLCMKSPLNKRGRWNSYLGFRACFSSVLLVIFQSSSRPNFFSFRAPVFFFLLIFIDARARPIDGKNFSSLSNGHRPAAG